MITSTNSIKVEASDGVLLLGITIDNKLTFKTTYWKSLSESAV